MTAEELKKKYPWLKCKSKKWTPLFNLPKGWKISFAEMFQEELREILDDYGLISEYEVSQIGEKYGALQWVDRYGCEETDQIVNKYAILSENICEGCGKPDVPMTDFKGWYTPLCEDCFKGTHEEYMKAIENSPLRMADTMEFDGKEIDISETADKIRKNWEEMNESKK